MDLVASIHLSVSSSALSWLHCLTMIFGKTQLLPVQGVCLCVCNRGSFNFLRSAFNYYQCTNLTLSVVDNREATLHVSRNSLGLVKDALEEIEEVRVLK